MNQSDRIPIVYARRVTGRETDLLIVACVYCRREHTHGVGGLGLPVGAGDGSRTADCGRGSYELREYRRPRHSHRGAKKKLGVFSR
jgi:hypothetical protein